MSENSGLPEWTAQALVALGAVFLLISAYVMGVMVPNGLLAPNDFDANFYFEGEIQTFDLDTETGEGVFIDNVGSGSYDPTKAKIGAGATLNVVGAPDGDDYTSLTQNFSLTVNGINGEGDWLGTISDTTDNPSMLNRKTYEVDGKQGAWTPTNLPEEGTTYEFPNPVNSDYTDNFTCSDKRMLDGLEVMTCIAESGEGEQMEFVPGEGSDLALLQNTFEGRNSAAGSGSAPMWFSYKAEYTVGTGIGGVVDRIFNVTIYMQSPTMVYLEDNFNFTSEYVGRVGSININNYVVEYIDATGIRAGCVNEDASTDTHINITGYLRMFEDNGSGLLPDYGAQHPTTGCWESSKSDTYKEELVNVTYDVNRKSLQYVNGTITYVDGVATDTTIGNDGFNFFAPVCETISVVSKDCWIPAQNASWPNAMHNPHMQNYTFIGEEEWDGLYAGVAYHFRANESDIPGLSHYALGPMLMNYYEDVWVDPLTGTVLDQKYNIVTFAPGMGNATIRDIVANYTEEQKTNSLSSAKLQAIGQYYQGNEVVVLTLNGAYTDKTVDEQISSQKESVDALNFGSKTLPSILIGGALVSLLAGFYVYYQNGGGAVSSMNTEESISDSVESDADESTDEPEEASSSDEEVTEDEDKQEMAITQEESSEED